MQTTTPPSMHVWSAVVALLISLYDYCSYVRKKRQAEVETYFRRMMKRFKKDLLIDTHKVKTQLLFGAAHSLICECSRNLDLY